MFSHSEWLDLLGCVQESIEAEHKRMDVETLESLRRARAERIDHLVSIKRRISALLGGK